MFDDVRAGLEDFPKIQIPRSSHEAIDIKDSSISELYYLPRKEKA